MKLALVVAWLAFYTLAPASLALFALIFAFEGFASVRSQPANLPFAVTATAFLVAWPLSALAGWILLAFGRRRAAWIVTGGTALALTLAWALSLALAVAAR